MPDSEIPPSPPIPEPPPNSSISDPPPPPPVSLDQPGFPIKPPKAKTSRTTIVLGLFALGLGIYYLGFYLPEKKAALQKQQEEARLAAQKKAEEEARPHKEIQALIADLRDHGTDLPDCPLIFPLLTEKGKVTPVGSYLSYMAMKKAVYLPEMVYRLPNAGEIFNGFDLFNPKPHPGQKLYLRELPFRFLAKDFGEGTWRKTAKGFKITLKFRGTRHPKKYSKVFPKNKLHLAPAWMASCLHQWTGFKPDAPQAAFLGTPVYTNDADFQKGAYVERVFRECPGLVRGWDKVLATHPDSSFLLDRWLSILDDREGKAHPEIVGPYFQKSPQDFFYRADYENLLIQEKEYEPALKLVFEDLKRDGNNSMWYKMAASALESWGYNEEAIQLVKTWCDKHPENQEAWMELSGLYMDYAWVARGTGWADTVTPEGHRLLRERMEEAKEVAEKAASLAPGDCRVWTQLLRLGIGVPFDKETMGGYFKKAQAINPYHLITYTFYLNYLAPKWFGAPGEDIALVRKYEGLLPFLIYDPACETFYDYGENKTEQEKREHLQHMAENVAKSPYLHEFEEGMAKHFVDCPTDTTNWGYYFYWMSLIGKRSECLALARKASPKDEPELKALFPALVLSLLQEEEWAKSVTHADADAFESQPDVVKLKGQALQDLLEADRSNWTAWNQLAKFNLQNKRLLEAKNCFETIGDHWMGSVWGEVEFKRAKRIAFGLPPPVPPTPVNKKP